MKKLSDIFSALMDMLNFGGCSKNTLDYSKLEKSNIVVDNSKINISIKEKNINQSIKSVTLNLENKTNDKYIYGLEFILEVEKDGEWYVVPFNEGVSFIEVAYILDALKSTEEQINLTYFKELPIGKYRIIKHFHLDGKDLAVGGEFEIVCK